MGQIMTNLKLPRRRFLHLAAGAVALPAVPRLARAQTYPSRPVRLVAATSPGSAPDVFARLIGQWLSERLGQPFVVENRAGGGGNIGTEAVVRAAADGHTLLLVSVPNATNATLYEKLNYNFLRDIAPIGGVARIPNVLVVHPSVHARTLAEFVTHAKANPGKINMASAGNGSAPHLAGELFKMMTNIDMVHVPYRGAAPAVTDLLGGQVQVMFPSTSSSVEYIKAGRLRALAVTSPTRWEGLPDVPAVGESIPGFDTSFWAGIGAPRNTPAVIIDRLNKEINAGLADPKLKARLADLGGTVLPGSPAEFGKLIAAETEKWAKVINFANIKPE
jgi:tripartite-type tricarboxylate transporter receptor subunit TctC